MPYEIKTSYDEWGNPSQTKVFVPTPSKGRSSKEKEPPRLTGAIGRQDIDNIKSNYNNEVAKTNLTYVNPNSGQTEVLGANESLFAKYEADIAAKNDRIQRDKEDFIKQTRENASNYRKQFLDAYNNKRKENKNYSFSEAVKDKDLAKINADFKSKSEATGATNISQKDINKNIKMVSNFTTKNFFGEISNLISGDTKHQESIMQTLVDNIATGNPQIKMFQDSSGKTTLITAMGEEIELANTDSFLDDLVDSFKMNSNLFTYGLVGSLAGLLPIGRGGQVAASYAGFGAGNALGAAKDIEEMIPELQANIKKITNGKGVKVLSQEQKSRLIDAGNFSSAVSGAYLDHITPEELQYMVENNPSKLQDLAALKELADGMVLQGVFDTAAKGISLARGIKNPVNIKIPDNVKTKIKEATSSISDKLPEEQKALVSAGLNKVAPVVNKTKAIGKAGFRGGLAHGIVGFGGSIIDPTGGWVSHPLGFLAGALAAKNTYKNNMEIYKAAEAMREQGKNLKTNSITFSPYAFIKDFVDAKYQDPAFVTDMKVNLARYGIKLNGTDVENGAAVALLHSPSSAEHIKVLAREFPNVAVNLKTALTNINNQVIKDINSLIPEKSNKVVETILNDISLQHKNNLQALDALKTLIDKSGVTTPAKELLPLYNEVITQVNKGKQITDLFSPSSTVGAKEARAGARASENRILKAGVASKEELKFLMEDIETLAPSELLEMKVNLNTIKPSLQNNNLLAKVNNIIDQSINKMTEALDLDTKAAFSLHTDIINNLNTFEKIGYSKLWNSTKNKDALANKLLELGNSPSTIDGTLTLLDLSKFLSPSIQLQAEGLLLDKLLSNAIDASTSPAKGFINSNKILKSLDSIKLVSPEAKAIKELLRDYNKTITDPIMLIKFLSSHKQAEFGSGIGHKFFSRLHTMLTSGAIKKFKNLILPNYNNAQYRAVQAAAKALMNPLDPTVQKNLQKVYTDILNSNNAFRTESLNLIQEVNNHIEHTLQQLYKGEVEDVIDKTLQQGYNVTSSQYSNLANHKATQILTIHPVTIKNNQQDILDDIISYSNKISNLLKDQGSVLDEMVFANSIIENINNGLPTLYKSSALPKFTEETYFSELPEIIEKQKNIGAPVGGIGGSILGSGGGAIAGDFEDNPDAGWGEKIGTTVAGALGGALVGHQIYKAFKKPPTAPMMQSTNTPQINATDFAKSHPSVNKIFVGPKGAKNAGGELNSSKEKALQSFKEGFEKVEFTNEGELNSKIFNDTKWFLDKDGYLSRWVDPDDTVHTTLKGVKLEDTTYVSKDGSKSGKVTLETAIDNGGSFKLENLYDSKPLYKSYPTLKNLPISIMPEHFFNVLDRPIGAVAIAKFTGGEPSIVVNAGMLKYIADKSKTSIDTTLLQTLRHELQHIVDFIEGAPIVNTFESAMYFPSSVTTLIKDMETYLTHHKDSKAVRNKLEQLKNMGQKGTEYVEAFKEAIKDKKFREVALNANYLGDPYEIRARLASMKPDIGDPYFYMNPKDRPTEMVSHGFSPEGRDILNNFTDYSGEAKNNSATNASKNFFVGQQGAVEFGGELNSSKEKAIQLFKNGKLNDEVFNDTKWFLDKDGHLSRWVDPTDSIHTTLKNVTVGDTIYGKASKIPNNTPLSLHTVLTRGGTFELQSIYNSPTVYAAYPKLKTLQIQFQPEEIFNAKMQAPDATATAYLGETPYIAVNLDKLNTFGREIKDTNTALLQTIRHEVQHVIDHIEGAPNSNPLATAFYFPRDARKALQNLSTYYTSMDTSTMNSFIVDSKTSTKLIMSIVDDLNNMISLPDDKLLATFNEHMSDPSFKKAITLANYYAEPYEIRGRLAAMAPTPDDGYWYVDKRDSIPDWITRGFNLERGDILSNQWFTKGMPQDQIRFVKTPRYKNSLQDDLKYLDELYNKLKKGRGAGIQPKPAGFMPKNTTYGKDILQDITDSAAGAPTVLKYTKPEDKLEQLAEEANVENIRKFVKQMDKVANKANGTTDDEIENLFNLRNTLGFLYNGEPEEIAREFKYAVKQDLFRDIALQTIKENSGQDIINAGVKKEIKRENNVVRVDLPASAPISEQFQLDYNNLEFVYKDIVEARTDPVRWVFENENGFLIINKPKKGRTKDTVAYYQDKRTKKRIFTPPFKVDLENKTWNESTAGVFVKWLNSLDTRKFTKELNKNVTTNKDKK